MGRTQRESCLGCGRGQERPVIRDPTGLVVLGSRGSAVAFELWCQASVGDSFTGTAGPPAQAVRGGRGPAGGRMTLSARCRRGLRGGGVSAAAPVPVSCSQGRPQWGEGRRVTGPAGRGWLGAGLAVPGAPWLVPLDRWVPAWAEVPVALSPPWPVLPLHWPPRPRPLLSRSLLPSLLTVLRPFSSLPEPSPSSPDV